MAFEWVVEKYKQRRWEAGIKIGREEGRDLGWAEGLAEGWAEGLAEGRGLGRAEGRAERQRSWEVWYEREQAALRAGIPFDEPPPGYAPESPANGADGG